MNSLVFRPPHSPSVFEVLSLNVFNDLTQHAFTHTVGVRRVPLGSVCLTAAGAGHAESVLCVPGARDADCWNSNAEQDRWGEELWAMVRTVLESWHLRVYGMSPWIAWVHAVRRLGDGGDFRLRASGQKWEADDRVAAILERVLSCAMDVLPMPSDPCAGGGSLHCEAP